KFGLADAKTQHGVEVTRGLYRSAATPEKAAIFYKELLLAQIKELGADHLETLFTKHELGGLYYRMRQFRKAIPLFTQVLPAYKENKGADHPHTLVAAFNLANSYGGYGQLSEATELIEEWLPRTRAKYGLGHAVTRFGLDSALSLYQVTKAHAKAEPLWR